MDEKKFDDKKIVNILKGLRTYTDKLVVEDSNFLNLSNGVLNLDTEELIPHSPDMPFTYQLPISYDPKAQAPNFIKFLKSSIPDMNEIDILQRFLGYVLSADMNHEVALFLIGEGGNGKGVLMKVISALIGEEFVSPLDMSELHVEKNRTLLLGCKVNLSTEMIARVTNADFKAYKKLTSFSQVLVRGVFKDPVHVRINCKMIFSSNEYPIFPQDNEAADRRFIPIHFPNSFTDFDKNHRRNPNLIDDLLPELPGILNWVLEGLKSLRKIGKLSVKKRSVEQYDPKGSLSKIRIDSIGCFIDEHLEEADDTDVMWDDFLKEYQAFCKKYNVVPKEKGPIGRKLKAKGFQTAGNSTRGERKIVRAKLKSM